MMGTISCGTSTRMMTSWTPAGMTGVRLEKVIVVSIMGGQYQAHQQTIENTAVRQLREVGIEALPSTEIFRPNEFRNMTEQQIVDRVAATGFTQVMMISLLDRDREMRYVPGRIRTRPIFMPTHPVLRQYAWIYNRVYEPGYYTSTTKYILEAQVFSLQTGDLLYLGQTKTRNPRNPTDLMNSFSNTIIEDMRSRGLIR